jgi:hypothetical protein
MSKESSNKDIRNDEIDLMDLFRRIAKTFSSWLKALGRGILISIVFLFRKWLPLALSVVAGVLVSLLLRTSFAPYYTADMVVRNNTVTVADMIPYINRLHTYSLGKNKNALSEALSLSPAVISNIKDISAFWIIDKGRDGIPDNVDYKNNHNVYDTINVRMKDRFDIRVKTNEPQELILIRDGIISFLNKDSLFQQKNRLRLKQNDDLILRLKYDILQLDSLQKVKYFEETRNKQPKNGGQMIFLQEQKTQLVYTDIYTLTARKQGLETERVIYPGMVTVLSEFTIPANRVNGVIYYGERIIPFFFFATILVMIFLANRKRLKEVYKKY